MASRTLLHDAGGLRIYLDTDPSGNRDEIQIDEVQGRAADAIAVRFGVWDRSPDQPVAAKFSYDVLQGSDADPNNAPRRSERIEIQLRTDDHPAATPGAGAIETYFQTQPVGQETDAGEKLALRLTMRAGLELFVPLNAYAGGAGTPSRVSRFYSDDGKYCYNVQGDPADGAPLGRLVQYATHGSTDETTWTAVATLAGVPL